MRALSIMQPWASLIAFGHKAIENRTWKPPASMIGQRFAIHASKKLDLDAFTELHHGMCGWKRADWPYAKPKEFPTSAIIATATLARFVEGEGTMQPGRDDDAYWHEPWRSIVPEQHRWYFGPVGFVLHDVERITPVANVKGALGFWDVPADVAGIIEHRRAGACAWEAVNETTPPFRQCVNCGATEISPTPNRR